MTKLERAFDLKGCWIMEKNGTFVADLLFEDGSGSERRWDIRRGTEPSLTISAFPEDFADCAVPERQVGELARALAGGSDFVMDIDLVEGGANWLTRVMIQGQQATFEFGDDPRYWLSFPPATGL